MTFDSNPARGLTPKPYLSCLKEKGSLELLLLVLIAWASDQSVPPRFKRKNLKTHFH